MILLFDLLSNINNLLLTIEENGLIIDFRITLRVNNRAIIYIVLKNENDFKLVDSKLNSYKHDKVEIEYLQTLDIELDPYFTELFKSKEKLFLDSRKKLSNLLEYNENINLEINCKVITFYSYKGGVGRSTTLASCAAYLSNHFNKKVLIIDCDLEAPGFTNYFLEEPSQINNHIGIVEYFMDFDFSPEKIDISKYIWEAGKEFSGSGSILVMPAGNLSEDFIIGNQILSTHKKHYLEGLARIDTSSSFNMYKKFSTLLKQIDTELNPDLILIDSKTGFNDIFGITAFTISNLVVGLFGNNIQNVPGLNFFIDRIIESKNGLNAVLINSIINRRSSFFKFNDYIENYIQRSTINDNDNLVVIKSFPITRYDSLEVLGTSDERKEDFIDLIRNHRFPDYNDIFNYINEITTAKQVKQNHSEGKMLSDSTELPIESLTYTEEIKQMTEKLVKLELKDALLEIPKIERLSIGVQKLLKKRIKDNLEKNWPKLYGEHAKIELENVFYRRSMEDIFNNNKFIVLGNKGTGKTFLYEALKQPIIVKRIQERAQKNGVFEFFHVVDKSADKFFDTNQFESDKDEKFYHRFWVVYIWNAVMLESEKRLGYKSNMEILPIHNNAKTKNRFENLIANEEQYIKIEDDLYNLESYLKSSNNQKRLIIIFDGLDQVVKPIYWHIKIVPLINYWRHHNFTRISPKLFLRSDLFEKLSNITNIKELKNQAISIEWSQDELFGYFFKLVLFSAKEEFLRFMLFTKNNSYELIKQIKQKSGKDNQLPLEEYYLQPLVKSFFGQYASADNTPRYGESYEWFYRNLKNANNTISLRPFIDLISNALVYAKTDDKSSFPILPAIYYVHGEARKTALSNHFSDLVSEQGNENLKLICDFIREKKSSFPVYLEMNKSEMINIITEIIKVKNIENSTFDDLIYLLRVNGIISENFRSNGISYSFALLYKYYLGLKNRPRGNKNTNR